MSAKQGLLKTLFDDPKRRHINVKFFRGLTESISAEDLCAEANTALFQLENGLLEPHDTIVEEFKQVEAKTLSFPD